MRSDHLSKHLKTHLSSKKTGSGPQQANEMPTLLTITQNPVKLEEDMIEELVLESQEDSNKQQQSDIKLEI